MNNESDQLSSVIGMVVGVAGAIALGGLLTGARDSILNANVALVLMVVVVIAAAIGGRAAGAVAAVAATLSFDFFHTEPYYSLTIDSSDDLETAVLLMIAALIVGQITALARTSRAVAAEGRSELRRIHRLAELAARGGARDEVIAVATSDLTDLLTLSGCRFEVPPYGPGQRLERLERSGTVTSSRVAARTLRYERHGFEFPHEGIELPVLAHGEEVGRFVLVPTPGVGASLEQRVVAIALADQVGAAVGAPPSPSS
jgi:hypothetical protein